METDEQIDLNQPINWDEIDEEFSGDVFGLNYVYVFEENDDGKLKLYSRDFRFSVVLVSGINELKHFVISETSNEQDNGNAAGHEEDNIGVDADAAAGSSGDGLEVRLTGRGAVLAGRGAAGQGTAGGVPDGSGAGRGDGGRGHGRTRLGLTGRRAVPSFRGAAGRSGAGHGVPDEGISSGRGNELGNASFIQAGDGAPGGGEACQGDGGRGRGRRGRGRGRLGLTGRGRAHVWITKWNAVSGEGHVEVPNGEPNRAGRGRGHLGLAGRGSGGLDLNISGDHGGDDEHEHGDG